MRKFELYEVDIMSTYAELDLRFLTLSTKEERANLVSELTDWVSSMVEDMEISKLAIPTDEARDKFLSVAKEELDKLFSLWEDSKANMTTVKSGGMRLVYNKGNKSLTIGYISRGFGVNEKTDTKE